MRRVPELSKLKLYLPRQKLFFNETVFFLFEMFQLAFNTLIPMSFLLVEAILKLLFIYGMELRICTSFNVFYILKSCL